MTQTAARAKIVAIILTDNGQPVYSPVERILDAVERARWDICLQIVQALDKDTYQCRICGGRVDLTDADKPARGFGR